MRSVLVAGYGALAVALTLTRISDLAVVLLPIRSVVKP